MEIHKRNIDKTGAKSTDYKKNERMRTTPNTYENQPKKQSRHFHPDNSIWLDIHSCSLLGRRTSIEPSEMRVRRREKGIGLASFDDPAIVKNENAIVIQDRVELVCYGEDGVRAEFLADHSLHYFVGLGIHAVGC